MRLLKMVNNFPYPSLVLNEFPAFIELNGQKMQFAYICPDTPNNGVYAFADSETTVQYISISRQSALVNRLFLSVLAPGARADVYFAKNKTKIMVGLDSLLSQTYYKKADAVTGLLAYSESDKFNYKFSLSTTAPSEEDQLQLLKICNRPSNINEILLEAQKFEKSIVWAANQAMMAKSVFCYIEDLIKYQGDCVNKKWLMNMHLAA